MHSSFVSLSIILIRRSSDFSIHVILIAMTSLANVRSGDLFDGGVRALSALRWSISGPSGLLYQLQGGLFLVRPLPVAAAQG